MKFKRWKDLSDEEKNIRLKKNLRWRGSSFCNCNTAAFNEV